MKRIWLKDADSIRELFNEGEVAVVAADKIETLLRAAAIADTHQRLESFRFQTSIASFGFLGRFTPGAATKVIQTLSVVASDELQPTFALWIRSGKSFLYARHGEIKNLGAFDYDRRTSGGALEFTSATNLPSGVLDIHGRTMTLERRVLRIEPGPSITWVLV